MKNSKKLGVLAIISLFLIVLVLITTSCGSSAKFKNAISDDMEPSAQNKSTITYSAQFETGFDGNYDVRAEEDKASSGTEKQSTEKLDDRKIIYSGWANVQTKEYEKSIELLGKLCEENGAYFENSSEYGNRLDYQAERSSQFKIRIPVANYFSFKNSVGQIGSVVESGENNVDITEKYIDIEARLESAVIREERVLELLKNANKLDDILALERELSDIRYEIETMTGSLRKYDSLVSYATFDLIIQEVIEFVAPKTVPKTFGERVTQNFKDGWRDFIAFWQDVVVYLSYNVFSIVIWLIVVVIVLIFISITKKRIKDKRELDRKKYIERANEMNRIIEKDVKENE